MPLFIIERNFADRLDLTDQSVQLIEEINDDVGVRWIYSFLSADKKKTYCLYEAPNAELIRDAARRANVPADAVIEVTSAYGEVPTPG
jgi:Nickel responsive protein SCO4226-like